MHLRRRFTNANECNQN
ncbi:hypothetical protein MTO96_050688, partial [Rhipicephalus appendiculatus]